MYQLAFAKELTGGDNPTGVIINDAVRLAKEYATEEDAAFTNGVLGGVAKELEDKSSEEAPDAQSEEDKVKIKAEGEDE